MRAKRFLQTMLMVLMALVLTLGTQTVRAEETSGSMTIRRAASGSEFSLYQVGTMDAQGNVSISSAFRNYAINYDLSSDSSMGHVAEVLATYIAQDHPTPYATTTAGTDGTVRFTDLERGLYLAIGKTVIVDGTGYIQNPIMAYVPTQDYDGTVIYNVEAVVKATTFEESTNYSVYKVWQGSSDHPDQIKVNLIQDEDVIETVTLNDENNWQYKWTDLEKGHRYLVAEEDVPEGYTVSISQDQTVFTITNTSTTVTPAPSTTPGITPTITPTVPHTPGIPQTGQLWWPVSILAAVGIICLLIGSFYKRRSGKDK